MDQSQILIVGGGVAGLAMANALAARGFNSIVLERRSSRGDIDRGDVIHHSLIAAFKNWNVYETFLKYKPLEFTEFRILNNEGTEIFHFDLSHDLEPPAKFTVLRHPEIENVLEEAALNSGLVDIRYGIPCLDFVVRGGRVVGVTTPMGIIEAELTIVANGSQSDLRDRYFGEREYYQYPVAFYNARFRLVPEFGSAGMYIIGENGIMILVPLPGNEMRIGLQFSRFGNHEKISRKSLPSLIQKRFRTFPVDSLEFIDAHVYSVSKSLNRTFYIPGAVLVGDVAHTTHPVGGQGMNLAFQDAELLSECLADTNLAPRLINEACLKYSRRRHIEVKAVLRRTHFLGMISLIDHPIFIKGREKLLMIANEITPFKRLVFQRIIDVR